MVTIDGARRRFLAADCSAPVADPDPAGEAPEAFGAGSGLRVDVDASDQAAADEAEKKGEFGDRCDELLRRGARPAQPSGLVAGLCGVS